MRRKGTLFLRNTGHLGSTFFICVVFFDFCLFFFTKSTIFAALYLYNVYYKEHSVLKNNEQKTRRQQWAYLGKIVGLNVVIIGALAAVLILCLSMWLDSYTHHNESVTVPDLHGVDEATAMAALQQQGLLCEVVDSVHANARPGSVVEQIPAAGLPVKAGRIVYLTINAYARRMVKMKEVRNGPSRDALSTLNTLGFVVDSIRRVPNPYDDEVLHVMAGNVELEPGQEYPVGTHVVVHVGKATMEVDPVNEEIEMLWTE